MTPRRSPSSSNRSARGVVIDEDDANVDDSFDANVDDNFDDNFDDDAIAGALTAVALVPMNPA
jgi:hypothetical protein